jgi:hypothetical protein
MATKNIVPRADAEGQLGTSTKGWGKIFLGGTAANIDVNDVSGTNTAGKSLTLISGASTGSGAGGSIVFQTAAAGESGTSVNSHATVLTLDSAKLATFTGGLDIAGAVDIAGDLTLSAGADGALNFSAASSIKILDNSATSLVIEEADTAYMTFVTTNSSEAIKFDKALDINAAVQLDSTLTVGVNDTGYDVKFFGATSGKSLLWDESADSLIVTGTTDLIGTTNLDIVDIDGAVNMATTALVTGVLTTTAATVFNGGFASNDGSTITVNDNTANLTLTCTDADATVGPMLFFSRNSASAATNDQIGTIFFTGRDAANSEDITYAAIETHINQATDGQEGGKMTFKIASHDAESVAGLTLTDGDAEDEVDVTIASGTSSVTTIAGNVVVGGNIQIPNDGTIGSVGTNGALTISSVGAATFSGYSYISAKNEGTSNGQSLVFATNAAGASATPKLTISSGGTVSIGSSTATNPLSIRTANGESYLRFLNADGTTYGDLERSITGNGAVRITTPYFRVTGTLETQGIQSALGIVFNNNSVTGDKTSVTLNDYEEGTWTPTIGGSETFGTYSGTTFASYVRIGNQVMLNCYFNAFALTDSTGDFVVRNLPYAPTGGSGLAIGSVMVHSIPNTGAWITVNLALGSATQLEFFQSFASGGWLGLPIVTEGSRYLAFSVSYTVQ